MQKAFRQIRPNRRSWREGHLNGSVEHPSDRSWLGSISGRRRWSLPMLTQPPSSWHWTGTPPRKAIRRRRLPCAAGERDAVGLDGKRSEESRVGQEGVRPFRYWGSPYL